MSLRNTASSYFSKFDKNPHAPQCNVITAGDFGGIYFKAWEEGATFRNLNYQPLSLPHVEEKVAKLYQVDQETRCPEWWSWE